MSYLIYFSSDLQFHSEAMISHFIQNTGIFGYLIFQNKETKKGLKGSSEKTTKVNQKKRKNQKVALETESNTLKVETNGPYILIVHIVYMTVL